MMNRTEATTEEAITATALDHEHPVADGDDVVEEEYLNEKIISSYKQLIDKEVIEKMIIEKTNPIEMKRQFIEQMLNGQFVKALKMTLFKDFQKPYTGVKMSEKRLQWFGSTTYHCFTVGDLLEWICKYYHINERESMIFVKMMQVLGWIGLASMNSSSSEIVEDQTIEKSDIYKVLIKPKLVVIGGGMAGYKVCKSILNEIFDLTVIDKEGTCDLVPIYPTLITDRNNADHICINHKKTLPDHVTCIKGVATNVTKYGVYFDSMETLQENEDLALRKSNSDSSSNRSYFVRYDYLIVGTGCTCGWSDIPIGGDNQIKFVNTYSADSLVESHDFIENASGQFKDEICVLGGGYVGVEVAGFLAEKHKTKNITLVQRSDILMRPSTESHQSVMEIFKTMGNVKVLLKSQIVSQKDSHTFTVKTRVDGDAGEDNSLVTDLGCSVCFISTGMKPQTDLLKLNFKCLDGKGFIQVNESMQVLDSVSGQPLSNVFAIGDATNVPETKLAPCAHKHAKTVCTVLPQIIQSTPTNSLTTYKPRGYEQLQGVIIGPNNGLWIKGNRVLLNSKIIAWTKENAQATKGRRMNKL